MKLLSTIIPPGTNECSETMRHKVLTAIAAQRALVPGEQILYVEVKLLPYPHLINCVVTVSSED